MLVEPEIPPNTGSVARLCAATGSPLHLVGKLGFRIDEHAVRRAGVDTWHMVDVRHHAEFADLEAALRGRKLWMFSAHATVSVFDAPIEPGDALVFGKESVGLDPELVERYAETAVAIPTLSSTVRSLNLANAVSVALYESLRKTGALATTFME